MMNMADYHSNQANPGKKDKASCWMRPQDSPSLPWWMSNHPLMSLLCHCRRSIDGDDGDDEPSLKKRCRRYLDIVLYEWRTIAIIILLIVICILIADMNIVVRWKALQDYKPTLSYATIKSK